ncbi:hypothetical protein TWF694_001180 [Orbilia ellipsospora]|uniref:Uncharacterized protein n=1 Tax=Orbilia ellipsospora TaxID=2528407 RepID=A0AAV9XRB1_9PEZI
MSGEDNTSTTAAKPSGVTPTTAIPNVAPEDQPESNEKSNLPASNSDPLPESPAYTPSDSVHPPPAEPAARPAVPTATINNLTEMPPAPSGGILASLDDDTTPTRTATTTVNVVDPPAPQPGAVPTPVSSSNAQVKKEDPPVPRPGAVPSIPSQTTAAAATTTSIPAPSFTMPPPVQTTYGPPGSGSMRGQPMHGYTATASTSAYQYPSAVRRGSEIAPIPGGYRQRDNWDSGMHAQNEEAPKDEGIWGTVSKAVDKFNEWMVGESK